MKNPMPIAPTTLFASLSVLLLAGCATSRPPRQVGPPVMPPVEQASQEPRISSQRDVMEETLISIPAPQPAEFEPAAPAPQPRQGTSYTIRKGESLSAIAARNKMSWRELADYNYITNPNKVRAGQVILIPSRGMSPSVSYANPAPVKPQPPKVSGSGKTYVVQSGDSLSVVASRYDTSVNELKSLNGLNSDRLLVGQILKLPAGASLEESHSAEFSQPAPRPTPFPSRPLPTPVPVMEDPLDLGPEPADATTEEPVPDVAPVDTKAFPIIVQEGDTLQSIADSYIVSQEEIRKLNKLSPNAEVKPGQKLQIPSSSIF